MRRAAPRASGRCAELALPLPSSLRTTIIPDLVVCARSAVQFVCLEHAAPSFRIRSRAEFRREGDRLADRQCAPRPRPGASPERGMDREFWRCGGPPPLRRASADGSARAGIEPMVPARKLGSLWLRPTAALGDSWPPLPLQSTLVLSSHVRTCRMGLFLAEGYSSVEGGSW